MIPRFLQRLRWVGNETATTSTADRAVMAQTFAYLYGTGGALCFLTLLLPHAHDRWLPGIVVPAGAALGVAGLLVTGFDRLPLWLFRILPALGAVLASVVVYGGGSTTQSAYAVFYFWVMLSVAYFFDRRTTLFTLGVVLACYAGALGLRPHAEARELKWVMAAGGLTVATGVILLLRTRVEGLIDRLADAARTDPLTGMLNRRGFEERFELELERARRSGRPLGVVVLDLDWFKQVNDRFGHHTGDVALQRVATIIGATARRVDTTGRLGGEEFAVIVPDADEYGAFMVAERIRQAIGAGFAEDEVALTASAGVAGGPRHGATADMLLRAADRALYAAKSLGKDRAVIFSRGLETMLDVPSTRDALDQQGSLATVMALAEVLDIRHTGTAEHSRAVGRYAEAMARALGFDEEAVERIKVAGVLHDIGKMGIGDAVLHKPGPLEDIEWIEVRRHPELGAQILQNAGLEDIASWVLAHHERPDGNGYPLGLRLDEIPIEARILAVADSYEAMTVRRVYRGAVSLAEARVELLQGSGSQFDVEVVAAFVDLIDRGGPLLQDRLQSASKLAPH